MRTTILLGLMACAAMLTTSCSNESAASGGDAEKGKAAIQRYGCAECHTIPGVPGATGTSGPSLAGIASRSHLAADLPNTPGNLIMWISRPRELSPKTAMPDSGITNDEAKDVAAYLYTLK